VLGAEHVVDGHVALDSALEGGAVGAFGEVDALGVNAGQGAGRDEQGGEYRQMGFAALYPSYALRRYHRAPVGARRASEDAVCGSMAVDDSGCAVRSTGPAVDDRSPKPVTKPTP